ncbi:MAG: DUF2062 domain-containing protein [Haloplanus sp.]
MIGRRLARARDRVQRKLEEAFIEEYTSREVALSFSIGVFVTALPTLGFGLVVFVVLASLFKQLSKIALFASVLVLNPSVKWGVYGTSFWIGNRLFGPVPGISLDGISLLAGPDILLQLWVGNLILATAFAVVAYVVAFRLVTAFRLREAEGSLSFDGQ